MDFFSHSEPLIWFNEFEIFVDNYSYHYSKSIAFRRRLRQNLSTWSSTRLLRHLQKPKQSSLPNKKLSQHKQLRRRRQSLLKVQFHSQKETIKPLWPMNSMLRMLRLRKLILLCKPQASSPLHSNKAYQVNQLHCTNFFSRNASMVMQMR